MWSGWRVREVEAEEEGFSRFFDERAVVAQFRHSGIIIYYVYT